jgi:hypothetical protein
MASLSRLDPQGFWTEGNISGDGHKVLPTEVDVLFVQKGKSCLLADSDSPVGVKEDGRDKGFSSSPYSSQEISKSMDKIRRLYPYATGCIALMIVLEFWS